MSSATARDSQWDKRLQRAEELMTRYPASAEVLAFYHAMAVLQAHIFAEVAKQRHPAPSGGLREQIDPEILVKYFPELLAVTQRHGPASLKQVAAELLGADHDRHREILADCANAVEPPPVPEYFLARGCVQPYAEFLAQRTAWSLNSYTGSVCPLCGARPQLGVLRPESEGGKRSLLCSFCSREWGFRRVVCAACGEQDSHRLPRYSAPEYPQVRVEGCDTCKTYLKTIDLTVEGFAAPLVDDIASAPLDLWAREHGYSKRVPNLMGF